MSNTLQFVAQDENQTDQFGKLLAETVPPGTVVALLGTLGAGKTRLVQALAVGCGIAAEDVVSPTFVLCQQYRGTRELVHFDAYRLKDDDEFLQLGAEEYFESDAVTLIEWADRVEDCLPPDYLEIRIEVEGPTARRFLITPHGQALPELTARLDPAEDASSA